jgi:hypothetical protein
VVGWISHRNGHLESLWIPVALELGLAISRDLFSRANTWRDRLNTSGCRAPARIVPRKVRILGLSRSRSSSLSSPFQVDLFGK